MTWNRFSSEEWTEIGASGAPSFQNSWVNYATDGGGSYLLARYRKIGDIVYVEGLIKSGTINATAFTLPVGFRPERTVIWPGLSNDAVCRIDVTPAGLVIPRTGSNAWVQMNIKYWIN